jgi:hypothetical protein
MVKYKFFGKILLFLSLSIPAIAGGSGEHYKLENFAESSVPQFEEVTTKPVTIQYYAFINPGIRTEETYIEEKEAFNRVLRQVYDRTRVDIQIVYQEQLPDREQTLEAFMDKLNPAIYGTAPVDLIYMPDDSWEVTKLIRAGQIARVYDLLKEHAPELHNRHSKKFWDYQLDVYHDRYSIPLREYPAAQKSGFWIIRDRHVTGSSKGEIINNCFDRFNYDQILLPSFLKRPISDYFSSWLNFEGYLTMKPNYHFITGKDKAAVISLYDLPKEIIREFVRYRNHIKTIFDVNSGKNGRENRTWMTKHIGFNDRYRIIYIPLNPGNIDLAADDLRKLEKEFSDPDNTFITDFNYNPLGVYKNLYIPEKSEKKELTLQLINEFIRDPYWYFLFLYGEDITDESFTNYAMTHKNTAFFQNKSGFRDLFSPFCDDIHYRIPRNYPASVRDEFKRFKDNLVVSSHPLDGLNTVTFSPLFRRLDTAVLKLIHPWEDGLERYIENPVSPEIQTGLKGIEAIKRMMQEKVDDYLSHR